MRNLEWYKRERGKKGNIKLISFNSSYWYNYFEYVFIHFEYEVESERADVVIRKI